MWHTKPKFKIRPKNIEIFWDFVPCTGYTSFEVLSQDSDTKCLIWLCCSDQVVLGNLLCDCMDYLFSSPIA